VVAEAGREPGVILADVDPEMSATTRRRIPALANARTFNPPAVTVSPPAVTARPAGGDAARAAG
jgi:predicted amidohydrolase